jgi:hypothetical protein
VEAAGVAQPYGIENRQLADSKFRSGCQNRYIRYLSLLKTYVARLFIRKTVTTDQSSFIHSNTASLISAPPALTGRS